MASRVGPQGSPTPSLEPGNRCLPVALHLGQQRAESAQVQNSRRAASQPDREDVLGAGRGVRGTRPQRPALALLHLFRPALCLPPPPPAGPTRFTLPLGCRSASGLAARTRTHRSVLTAPGLEKEQVSREWAARRLARAGIMANLGSEAEREPLLGPGSPESRFFYCDNVHLAISSKD
eukprot:XP_006500869.1 PREDICTED: uncharacterized protein 6430590A07Rik [Mus musculus]